LTEFDAKSGDMNYTKVVDNFDIFLESIDTSTSNLRFRSYVLCKLGVLLEFPVFRIDQATWINLDFKPTSNGELEE
jgi:hypothetical protein